MNFALCHTFEMDIRNMFRKKRQKDKTEIRELMGEIEFMSDIFLCKRLILHRIMSKMRRFIEAQYYMVSKLVARDPNGNKYVFRLENYLVSANFGTDACPMFMAEHMKGGVQGFGAIVNDDNLFGLAVRTKKPVISNDLFNDPNSACRFPPGHPVINSFLAIPFINHQGTVYAVIGFANKGKFTTKDIDALKPLTNLLHGSLEEYLK